MGREEPGDSHPIIKWVHRGMGGPWARWVRSGPSLSQCVVNLKCNIMSYIFYESQTFPTPACLNFPLKKNLFEVAEGLEFSSFWICFELTRDNRSYLQGEIVSPTSFPWGSFEHKVSELLSITIKVPHGDLGCSWRSCSAIHPCFGS
jgi:hypothetical protein